MVAAIEAALPSSDALPQFTNLLGLVNVSTHLVPIEEVASMDVVATIFTLFNGTDVTSEVVEDWVAFMLSDQAIQVIEHVLDT